MAKVGYDDFAGLERLAEAAATVDQRAAIVLTYHAALEREIDVVLARLLPRPDRIKRFGFGHKLDVLGAAWRGSNAAGDKLYDVLFRFNELRNAVAHGDRIDLVEDSLDRLLQAYSAMTNQPGEGLKIEEMAAGICGFMADRPPPGDMLRIGKRLESVIKKFGDGNDEDAGITE